VIPGSQVGDMLTFARYDKEALSEGFNHLLNKQIRKGRLTEEEAGNLTQEYEIHYSGYTYLDANGRK
jgi:arginine decarboxylase-like protein